MGNKGQAGFNVWLGICVLGGCLLLGGVIWVGTSDVGFKTGVGPVASPHSAASYLQQPHTSAETNTRTAVAGSQPNPDQPGNAGLDFPDTRGIRPPAWKMTQNGEEVTARCKVDGKEMALTPNQLGQFQRVYIGQVRTKANLSISYPQGEKGQTVVVESADGGKINDAAVSAALSLDDNKNINFDFTSTDDKGIYRVILRKGKDLKYLEFWVGQPHPLQQF